MIDPFTRKRLEAKLRVANAQIAALRARLAGATPGPGKLLLLRGADPVWLWAGLTWHSESEDLLLCVPADEAPYAGAADVRTDEASWPVTLRCGYSTWLPRPLLDTAAVVAEVSEASCSQALDRIEQLIDGAPMGSTDDDDGEADLEEWYDRLDRAACEVATLRSKAEEQAEAARAKRFVPIRTPVPQRELACAASGPTAEWPMVNFRGPGDREYVLDGGVTEREHLRTTFLCRLINGRRYPVVFFQLGLKLADGRISYAIECDVSDGATVTFEGIDGPDDLREVEVTQRGE